MASISSLGVGSGLDLGGLLDQLRSAERQKLTPIVEQKTEEEARISAFGRLQSGLEKFQTAVDTLNDASTYSNLTASVLGEGMTATTSDDANAGSYEITVNQTARAGSLASTQVTDLDAPLTGANASLDLTFGDGSTTSVALTEGATLGEIRDTINADAAAGVDASIINDGTGYRLVLSSRESGADAGVNGMTFTNADASLAEDAATLQAGRDAEMDINGIAITSTTNTVEDAIQGVTLELEPSASGETLSLTVAPDTESLKEAVKDFVSAYNEMKSTVGRMTKATGDVETAGELVGDRKVRTIESRLSRDLTNPSSGGDLEIMSSVGISLNDSGRLELDEDKLDEVIADNPEGLQGFFAGTSEDGGFAGRLASSLDNMLDTDGMIERAIDSAESRVDRIEDRYDRTERHINRTLERYRSQFSQLDGMIAQMNSTSAYLSQQLSALNQQS
ncbi:flagellar filament capping protein FliD [Halomonas nitroreducens]|uniref:Flagellar hook-associated protein 2 n=1 Tax=Halomonas nitroreducens TaxID=447425 RepID=A0A431V3I8_9GAMM|nr:flagellar filament capping protein FliD [Halomonas nitroreducens]RTR04414.1 flagellar hook protein [Halomonas nitroreducens]